ncbi:hypothetical protein EDB83DRAFT_842794 [Lactarius deliciosus]|nr:hypothetical protein EDB83DRAFT_842794 [Lactarius deliciosus]
MGESLSESLHRLTSSTHPHRKAKTHSNTSSLAPVAEFGGALGGLSRWWFDVRSRRMLLPSLGPRYYYHTLTLALVACQCSEDTRPRFVALPLGKAGWGYIDVILPSDIFLGIARQREGARDAALRLSCNGLLVLENQGNFWFWMVALIFCGILFSRHVLCERRAVANLSVLDQLKVAET